MAVFVIGELEIKNNTTLPVLAQSRIIGGTGWIVADIAARDAIPAGARLEAMEVKVIDDGSSVTRKYSLAADLTTWSEVSTTNLTVLYEDGVGSTAIELLKLQRTTSGTPAAGIGASIGFYSEVTADTGKIGELVFTATDVGPAERGAFAVNLMTIDTGALINVLKLDTLKSRITIGENAGDTSGSVGFYSITIGTDANGATANIGIESISIGQQAETAGSSGTSVGSFTVCSGNSSLAIASRAECHSIGALAIGNNAEVETSANSGISIGKDSIIQTGGTSSIVIGDSAGGASGTIGNKSITIGESGNAGSLDIGTFSIQLGTDGQSPGLGSISMGRWATTTAQGAIMMGYHASAITNDRTDSFALGWDEAIPSLWIEKYTTTTSGVGGQDNIDIPLDASSTYDVEAVVVGGETDATPTMFASRHLKSLFQRIGAGVAVEEMEQSDTIKRSAAAASEVVSIDISASGNNARIVVKGPNATSTAMNWRALVKLTKVASN